MGIRSLTIGHRVAMSWLSSLSSLPSALQQTLRGVTRGGSISCPVSKSSVNVSQVVGADADKIAASVVTSCPFLSRMSGFFASEKPQSPRTVNPQTKATSDTSHYQELFKSKIDNLKDEGRYRVFRNIERDCGSYPAATTDGQQGTVNWCSNDYLAMGQHPAMLQAATSQAPSTTESPKYGSANQFAASDAKGGYAGLQGGSAGLPHLRSTVHNALEREVADLHKKQQALVYNSCYTANEASIAGIVRAHPGCVIISDSDNHASMIQGIRQSGAPKLLFEHNNIGQLRSRLDSLPADTPKLVIFESVYSMDGTVGKIAEILQLCSESSNTISFIDEVHAVGLYGDQGGGVCQQLGLEEQVDVITGTLGKAYGALGGYVALSTEMRHKLEDSMLQYQKECFLPAPMLNAALSAVQHLRVSQAERSSHQANAAFFRRAAEAARLPVMDSESHIMPLAVGDPVKCCEASQLLFEKHGIYVQPINYPTVPVGSERLRCTPGPMHSHQMIIDMVSSLRQVYEELGIPLAEQAMADEVTHSQPLPSPMMEAPRVNQASAPSACVCAPMHPMASMTCGADTVADYRLDNQCPFSVWMPQCGQTSQIVY